MTFWKKMMKVLVTDGNNRVALSIIRALGREGVEITCTEQAPFARMKPISFASKYVRRTAVTPALDNPRFIPELVRIARGHDVILPASTNTVFALARNKHEFLKEGVAVPLPDHEIISEANDKFLLANKAKAIGIPVPNTVSAGTLNEALVAARKFGFPVVMKLRSDESLYLPPSQRYAFVHGEDELAMEFKRMSSLKKGPLIQQFIKGTGYGFFCLMDSASEPVAIFCHERLREFPSAGGPSTYCKSVYDHLLIEHGIKLLKSLKWTGPAMVEFRKSSENGKYYLLEVNPRYWGSLPLALASGVNFPYIHCRLAMGEAVKPTLSYRTDRYLRFVMPDALSIMESFLKETDMTKTFDAVFSYAFGRSAEEGTFNLDDRYPGLLYIKNRLTEFWNS